MKIVPIKQKDANRFVLKYHRHHKPVVGSVFQIGCEVKGNLVGVAICGRPVARKIDHTNTIEVNRLCVLDEMPNVCSKLYAACSRIAKEMGYRKIITYILETESGISLKAAGWREEKRGAGGVMWNSSKGITRSNEIKDLFGSTKKYPAEFKVRWSKMLNGEQEDKRSVATEDASKETDGSIKKEGKEEPPPPEPILKSISKDA